jgi:glutamate racemase
MKTFPDEASIGVFDSGVGGLSVLRSIRQELPAEHLSYVADSANAPYGDRHAAFIEDRASIITEFLLMAGVKAIVVACNTVTVVAIEKLRAWCPVPIVAMEPAIRPASCCTRSKVVGVLATSQTLASCNVARLCALQGNDVRILLQACPGLVEQVERTDLTSETTRSLLVRYLSPLLEAGADTIVLGCTHYLFLGQLIREIVGPDISIVDSTAAVARELARRLGPNRKTSRGQIGNEQFFSSAPPEQARIAISALWGRPVIVHGLVPGSLATFGKETLGVQIS